MKRVSVPEKMTHLEEVSDSKSPPRRYSLKTNECRHIIHTIANFVKTDQDPYPPWNTVYSKLESGETIWAYGCRYRMVDLASKISVSQLSTVWTIQYFKRSDFGEPVRPFPEVIVCKDVHVYMQKLQSLEGKDWINVVQHGPSVVDLG